MVISELVQRVLSEFRNRFASVRKLNTDLSVSIYTNEDEKTLWLSFRNGTSVQSISVPKPFIENGITLIEQNGVKRAVGKFMVENKEVEYLDIIDMVFNSTCLGVIKTLNKKSSFVKQLVIGFRNGFAPTVVHNLQRAINEITNRMPLHETNMNSWAMNKRVVIIDPVFDMLTDPAAKLQYRIDSSKELFAKGWSPIGLSDGVLTKNYTLTEDLRKLTPFGLRHHNPQRNLYSTLGMKGDERQLVLSNSAKNLSDMGIFRTGWNWLTIFADVPDVWEDQIMVDESHADKFAEYERRFQCFGELTIKEGDILESGQIISIESDGPIRLSINADEIKVKEIYLSATNVGGIPTPVKNVILTVRRNIKEGVKITNTAANKGIVRLAKLGVAIDPRTGKERKIDVIVSIKSVQKRKNYSQILEAIQNNINDNKPIVIPDDAHISKDKMINMLKQFGFSEDGMWECVTYTGKFKALVGTVFWGITHDAEDTVWNRSDVMRENNRSLRIAGLKFSTVEFRALETRFGKNNPLMDEILLYAQGTKDIQEEIKILKGKIGIFPVNVPIVDINTIKPLDQSNGTMVDKEILTGTIVDESLYPNGFLLKLPIMYQVTVNKNNDTHEGPAHLWNSVELNDLLRLNMFNQIYVPNINLRKSWKHMVGRFGLNDIGAALNSIIAAHHRYKVDNENSFALNMYYKAIYTYFNKVSNKMGTKRGEIATYGMAVRYPNAVKAVATLSNRLPENTVEIHTRLAKILGVKNGDIVLCERFPCLGFMSIRPQKVRITNDPKCKWTIRTSKTSLKSLNLDYDGDVIYLASFHTPEAKEALRKEWEMPNKYCKQAIDFLNAKSGVPHYETLSLQDLDLTPFEPLTSDTHAELVKRATGVKSHTGPVIALAYNIMRLIENSELCDDQKINVGIEMFLDKVGNSVFSQKHGVKSLHDIVIEAISKTDIEMLVSEGFDRKISTLICNVIRKKMKEIGIKATPEWYYENVTKKGKGNIINKLVRIQNKIYFSSRSQLEGCQLLEHLDSPVVDVPSRIFHSIILSERDRENKLNVLFNSRMKEQLHSSLMKDTFDRISEIIDYITGGDSMVYTEKEMQAFANSITDR